MDFNSNFGAFFRTEQIIMAQNGDKDSNIFTHDHLYGLYFLQSLINTKSVVREGRELKIDNLCYKPVSGKGCYRPSPLDLWKMDMGTLANDT
jgi:Niemann-Pick C1 protein